MGSVEPEHDVRQPEHRDANTIRVSVRRTPVFGPDISRVKMSFSMKGLEIINSRPSNIPQLPKRVDKSYRNSSFRRGPRE